jgi:hypothetical protein
LKAKCLVLLTLLLMSIVAYAAPNIPGAKAEVGWTKMYTINDAKTCWPSSLVRTSDGGYAISVIVNINSQPQYYELIKLDSGGNPQWSTASNSSCTFPSLLVLQTKDGGLLLKTDDLLSKLDSSGNVQWNYSYSQESSWSSPLVTVIQTIDGGYVLGGYQVSGSTSSTTYTASLEKIDGLGQIQWTKTYPLQTSSYVMSVIQLGDGSYVLGCQEGLDLTGSGSISRCCLVGVDQTGTLKWRQDYAGTENVSLTSVLQTRDGGFVIGGFVNNLSNYDSNYINGTDVWLMKVNSAGMPQWNQTYGGSTQDQAVPWLVSSDGGIVFSGYTYSFGNPDAWLFKVDSSGKILMSKTYGWPNATSGCMGPGLQTSDGGYLFAVTTNYTSPIGSFALIKTNSLGETFLTPSNLTVPEPKTPSNSSLPINTPTSLSPSPTVPENIALPFAMTIMVSTACMLSILFKGKKNRGN